MAKKRTVLEEAEVRTWVDSHPGWSFQDGAITKLFRLKSFRDSIVFVNRVASIADDANHHPDLDIRYDKVRVTLTTHDSGGVTQTDLDVAKSVDFATSSR